MCRLLRDIIYITGDTHGNFVRVIYLCGTITRKEYYDIFPEERDEFLKDITKEEIDEFISTVSSLPDYKDMPRIQSFTENEFYKCCALGYKENNYEFTDLSPKEQYSA